MTTKTFTIPSEADLHAFFQTLLNTVPRYRLQGSYDLGNTSHKVDESFETREDVFDHYQEEIFREVYEHIYDSFYNDPKAKELCIKEWDHWSDPKPWNQLDEDEQDDALDEFVIETYCDFPSIHEDINVHYYDYHKVLEECMAWLDDEDDEVIPMTEDDAGCEYFPDGLIKYPDGIAGMMMSKPKLQIVEIYINEDNFYKQNHKVELEVALVCDVLIDGNIVSHKVWSQDFTLSSGDCLKLDWHGCIQ